MLKNLNIYTLEPDFICAGIARINGIDLDNLDDYFEYYETGVYRHDGFIFNFDHFITYNCDNHIKDKWVMNGVCDDYHQILEKYDTLLSNLDKNYVIGLSTVERSNQPSEGGWRWGGWGEYIGTQNPEHEYIYHDTHIDRVYCFHIYEID